MATYNYKCSASCDFDDLVTIKKSMKDDTVPACPECGEKMVQHFSKPATFRLDGKGWAGKNLSRRR